MPEYRVEVVHDPVAGKYYAQLYYPADAPTPLTRTLAVYDTEAEAVARVEQLFPGSKGETPVETKAPAEGEPPTDVAVPEPAPA